MLTSNRNTKDYNQTYLDGENVSLNQCINSPFFEKYCKSKAKCQDSRLKKIKYIELVTR